MRAARWVSAAARGMSQGAATEALFEGALGSLDDAGSSKTPCCTKVFCKGRLSYKLMLMMAAAHMVWLLSYGAHLIQVAPSCQITCDYAEVAAVATAADGSCLLVATDSFGDCDVSNERSVVTASGLTVEVADLRSGAPACKLGNCEQLGQVQMGTHGQIRCILQDGADAAQLHFEDDALDQTPDEQRLCYVDSLSLKDVDDDSYPQCIPDSCPTRIQQQFAAWIQIFSAVFFFAFAADWLGRENDFAMFAFFAAFAVVEFRALGVAIKGSSESDLVGWNAVITTVLGLVYLLLAFKMSQNFGVYIYRYTKVDVDLRSIFLNLTLLRTKLKFDVAISSLNLIVCYVFFMQSVRELLVIVPFFSMLQAAKLVLFRAAIQENFKTMLIGSASLLFEPIYMLVQIVRMLVGTWQGVSESTVFGLFLISVVVRVFVIHRAYVVRGNFGQGLKERLGGQPRKNYRLAALAIQRFKASGQAGGQPDAPKQVVDVDDVEPFLPEVPAVPEVPAEEQAYEEAFAKGRLKLEGRADMEEEEEGGEPPEAADTHEDISGQGPCHHWGNLVIDGRGHRRHFWDCCGRKLNSDADPDPALHSKSCVPCAADGTPVERLIEKWKELQEALKAAENVAKIWKESEEQQKKLQANAEDVDTPATLPRPRMNFVLHDIAQRPRKATSKNLIAKSWKTLQSIHASGDHRMQRVGERLNSAIKALDHDDACRRCECTPEDRAKWQNDWVYTRNVYELVKTEESFVKMLMLLKQQYYDPMSSGKRGSPHFDSSDVSSIFSSILQRDGAATGDDADMIEAIPDLLTLHSAYVLPALLEEERQSRPSIAAFFQRIVADKLLVHQLAMAVPIAANENNAQQALRKLQAEDELFKTFMEETRARFQPVPPALNAAGLSNVPLQPGALVARPRRRVFEYRNVVEAAMKLLSKRVPVDERHHMSFEAAELRGLDAVMVELTDVCDYMNRVTTSANEEMKKVLEIDHLMGAGRYHRETNTPLVTVERQWKKGDGTDALFFEWDFDKNSYHAKPRQLVLFNDLLVCTVPTKSRKHPLSYYESFYARNLNVCETTETHLLVCDSTRGQGGFRAYKIDDQMGMNDWQRAGLVREWIRGIKQSVDTCDRVNHSWSDLQMARLKEAAEEEGIGKHTLRSTLYSTMLLGQ